MRAVEIETEYSERLEERRDPDGDFYGTVRFLLGLTAVFLAFVAIFTNVRWSNPCVHLLNFY